MYICIYIERILCVCEKNSCSALIHTERKYIHAHIYICIHLCTPEIIHVYGVGRKRMIENVCV